MEISLQALNQNFSINYKLVLDTFDNLSDNTALRKMSDNTNCSHWLLGHLVTGRQVIAGLAGVVMETERWHGLYGRRSKFSPETEYPRLAEIRSEWIKVSDLLTKALNKLDYKDLSVECPFFFPLEDKTVLGGISFLALHEGYHVGQLGMLRKKLGLPRFFDPHNAEIKTDS